ncbi:MAG: methyltransferase domain-containing protein [Nitrospirae bacterium]|nr:methyltransferase domain-containing protein [Nitrospirota bacterium]
MSEFEIENVFNTMAEEYDDWYDSDEGRTLYENEVKCLKSLAREFGEPILEIGVGTGRFAMHFPGPFGVDPAFHALKLAQRRGIKCVMGRGEDLPFREKIFGTVLIIITLCFVKDPEILLREAERVLAEGGCIIIGFIPGNSPLGMFYDKKKKEGSLFYRDAGFHTISDIEDFAREAGLEVTGIKSTLMQNPTGPATAEVPLEGYVDGAGFVCVRAERPAKRRPKS